MTHSTFAPIVLALTSLDVTAQGQNPDAQKPDSNVINEIALRKPSGSASKQVSTGCREPNGSAKEQELLGGFKELAELAGVPDAKLLVCKQNKGNKGLTESGFASQLKPNIVFAPQGNRLSVGNKKHMLAHHLARIANGYSDKELKHIYTALDAGEKQEIAALRASGNEIYRDHAEVHNRYKGARNKLQEQFFKAREQVHNADAGAAILTAGPECEVKPEETINALQALVSIYPSAGMETPIQPGLKDRIAFLRDPHTRGNIKSSCASHFTKLQLTHNPKAHTGAHRR